MHTRTMLRVLALVVGALCLPVEGADKAPPSEELIKLAEGGDAGAQYDVAQAYLRAIDNVDEDIPVVNSWLLKAAEQGLPEAQCDLGVGLAMPDKPWTNMVEALKWFTTAGATALNAQPAGSKDRVAIFAYFSADRIGKAMTEDQQKKAHALATSWLKEHGITGEQEIRNMKSFVERQEALKK